MSSGNIETRTRILKSTLELFDSGEAGGIRMSDIAKRTGLSRQALYLHFRTRGELLVAATHHLDEICGSDERLAASRSAPSGRERLHAYIQAWGTYIPAIYSMAKVMLAMKDTDKDAAEAWGARMIDMKEGCQAAIAALARDGQLTDAHSQGEATDILWTMLSVRNWEQLTIECGWTQKQYIATTQTLAQKIFVTE